MKNTHKEEVYIKTSPLIDRLFDESSIFFDIETTGFSPTTNHIYMIGCARRKNNVICFDQFFAENKEEEKLILTAFLEILKLYDTIISYNGIGFDIPFLKSKCDQYQLEESFKDYSYLDIFKSISQLKFLLKLDNYKQKTIEKFLGINREDLYSGGELINVYHEYIKAPTEEAYHLLHIHNYEDVLGMIDLLPILSYLEVFHGQYAITEVNMSEYRSYSGEDAKEMILTLKNDYEVPKRVSYKFHDFYLTMNQNTTSVRVPVYEGELHYFYPNYKDYYYLPEEDIALHKSVAGFVDKAYRENAKAYNCYNRKSGIFLPQCECIMQPEFRNEYKDKISYFELTDDFASSDVMLRRYVDHILMHMLIRK